MRIGLVTPSWPGIHTANGITTAVSHLADGLRDLGHNVTIIAMRLDAPCSDLAVIEVPAADTPGVLDRIRSRLEGKAATHKQIAARLTQAVRRAIDAHGIEILVMEETQGWAGFLQPKVPIPVVVTLHGPWLLHKKYQSSGSARMDRLQEARELKAFQTCAGITAPSGDVLSRVGAACDLPDIPKAVIPNPMPARAPCPSVKTGSRAARSILFIGRFDTHKGGDVLLDAFQRLTGREVEAFLTFVGPDRGVLQPDGTRLHIDTALAAIPETVRARIDYRGPLDKSALDELRCTHALTVITSRYETMGYTVLEAMAKGAAIVSTAVGGPAEFLRDGKTARLVPSEDPDALADACAELLADPAQRERLGRAAHAEIVARYGPASIGVEMVDFLRTVLNRWDGSRSTARGRRKI